MFQTSLITGNCNWLTYWDLIMNLGFRVRSTNINSFIVHMLLIQYLQFVAFSQWVAVWIWYFLAIFAFIFDSQRSLLMLFIFFIFLSYHIHSVGACSKLFWLVFCVVDAAYSAFNFFLLLSLVRFWFARWRYSSVFSIFCCTWGLFSCKIIFGYWL